MTLHCTLYGQGCQMFNKIENRLFQTLAVIWMMRIQHFDESSTMNMFWHNKGKKKSRGQTFKPPWIKWTVTQQAVIPTSPPPPAQNKKRPKKKYKTMPKQHFHSG